MSAKDDLIKEAKDKGVQVPEGATKAEVQALLDEHNAQTQDSDETAPNEQAAEDVEKSGVQGVSAGSTENTDAGADEPDAKSDGANDEDQTVAPQADGIDGVDRDHTPAGTTEEANQGEAESKEVETELGTSTEEAAAARAGVQDERLNDPKQNREPKNEFEASNQKVTEEERQAAQKVSDMTTSARVEDAPTPNESAHVDAERTAGTNAGSEIAAAIVAGLKESKNDNFELMPEPGVEHRFTLVKNKQTGEVMIRENETGTLSKIQLLSLEEKEADVQSTEVEEL